MRPNNNNSNSSNNRRGRSRGPRKPHGGPHSGISNKGQGYDGNAADVRVRGNAYQVLEKYLQLARDAGTVGDRVAAENFLQHADHYYRVVAAMQEGQRPRIGGRDVSVAEINVQNGSQGLSTALYSGHSQPGAQPDNGGGDNDGGDNGGGKAAQGNGQSDNRQNSGHQGNSHQSGNHQGGTQSDDRGGGSAGFASGASEPVAAQPNYTARKTMDEQPDYPADATPAAAHQAAGGEANEGDRAGNDPDRGQDRGGQDRGGQDRGGRGRGRRPARRPREAGGSTPNTGDSGE